MLQRTHRIRRVPRFMLMVYAGETDPGPTLERVQAMNAFNEELNRAGALLALDGLLRRATRVRFKPGEQPTVTDGPFTEAKELVGGYWIIQARSKEEAVEWALRAPIGDGTIEVRKIGEAEDYSAEVAEARKLSSLPPDQTVADE
jgi:hypothetical protein